MVFAAVAAAHHALAAHIQTLDGTGSGCGPTGNNCSGPTILHHKLWGGNKSNKYVLGDSPKQDIDQKSGASGFFGGGKQSLPANHGYMINSWRSGSAQGVAYDVPKDYLGYGHTGMHSGLFKFYGGPASGHSASSMLGRNVDGGVHVHARHHAFGSDSSQASAMYVPSTHQAQTGFYGNQHALSWQKSITRTKALPEQLPSGRLGGPGAGAGGGSGAEARFIMGQSFSHGQNLTTATSMVKSGHASASTTAKFITSRSSGYNYDSVPSGHSSHGVSFGSQTMRTDHMFRNTVGQSSGTSGDGGSGGVARYNQAIRLNNNAATSGSAYAMDLNHSLTGSRILDRPYHPASASFCDLHPDKCFFSPQPETQGMGGGYHSI